jgi:WD40 repeat protein
LASGRSSDGGEIKVWNIEEQVCIYSFDTGGGFIYSLFFAGDAVIAIMNRFPLRAGSIIRLWREEGSSAFESETIGEVDLRGPDGCSSRIVFSFSGSSLATIFSSRAGNGSSASTLALLQLETMNKTQSVVLPGFISTCIAVSPDSKQLVCGDVNGRIRLFQTDDFSIQRNLDATRAAEASVCSVAFDPTCRVLAFGRHDGRLELRTL